MAGKYERVSMGGSVCEMILYYHLIQLELTATLLGGEIRKMYTYPLTENGNV